jgi:predicted DCC family thiol-disulfide oxidoreductase YuxK
MRKLYVLYDSNCELCRHLEDWVVLQESWVELAVMPAGSEVAARMFPELKQIATANDLVVVSDAGEVYLNDRAWIMVLYALSEYRDWAARLTHPLLMPLARQAYAALARNRYLISRWMSSSDPEAIASELRQVEIEPCALSHQGEPSSDVRDYLQ